MSQEEMIKYMLGLTSTEASVPTREHDRVPTDANARMKRRRESGETDNNVLGAYGLDMLNKIGKLLLHFSADNKHAIFNTFFCIHESGYHVRFRAPTVKSAKVALTTS